MLRTSAQLSIIPKVYRVLYETHSFCLPRVEDEYVDDVFFKVVALVVKSDF